MIDSQPSQMDEPVQPSEPLDDHTEPNVEPASDIPLPQSVPASPIPPNPPATASEPNKRRKKRGSLFFPLLLIAAGVVLLLSNLGFLSGSAWETLINLWPVLFIVWGLDSIWREEGLTGAIFLLGLGVVFLLGNFGYIQLNPWQVLLIIWPVLLVAIGMDILIGRHRTWWLNLLGLILVITIMAGALWLAGVGLPGGSTISGDRVEYNLQGATQAEIRILPAVATVELGGSVNPGTLLEGIIPASTSSQKIMQEFTREGDKASLTLQSTGLEVYVPSARDNQSIWKLALTQEAPIDLEVSLGAGEGNLDLTGLQISNLDFNLGVGQVKIILPAEGKFTASIDGAIGQVIILVPTGMAVQLESNTLLAGKTFPVDYLKTGNNYASPGFSQAENQVTLDVGIVFGQVTIEEK